MKTRSILMIAILVLGLAGCASMSRQEKGAVIGAGSGAVIGGVIGNQAGNTVLGAIIGAAVGGAAGAYIGNYMDKQAAEIEQDLAGARVERIGEGIKITFDSGLLFDVNKFDVKPAPRENLVNLAVILNKYPDTLILIEGHTDSTGPDDYNMTLSQNRANAVAAVLAGQQVDATRFTVIGYGEGQPLYDNETVEGRQGNRRVDIAIMANDKLKKVAKDQAG
ncbi:MAG: OmpA family protein [Candidatus Krumholzibacteria bacterium]|jgi:outer membrane protein OmpA-like peptidoglycan-associated protein|nr:OmpA family protein [Candidatus Krumholzibacteria bacterium]